MCVDRKCAPSSSTASFYVCFVYKKPALELSPATAVLTNTTVILVAGCVLGCTTQILLLPQEMGMMLKDSHLLSSCFGDHIN